MPPETTPSPSVQYLGFHFGNCSNSNSRTSSVLQLSSREILRIRLACFWSVESQILTEMEALGEKKKINVDQGLREDDKGEKVTT